VISGLGGNDYIEGRGGNDILHGNAGNDTLIGTGTGHVNLYGDAGDDTFRMSSKKGFVHGGIGNDTIILEGNADRYKARELDGENEGTFFLQDLLKKTEFPITKVENFQFDNGTLSRGQFILKDETGTVGTPANDVLQGTSSADRIFGVEGDDRIEGSGGNDYLSGGKGNDIIISSGEGSASLFGGSGNDRFEVALRAVVEGGRGTDTLKLKGNYNDFVISQNTSPFIPQYLVTDRFIITNSVTGQRVHVKDIELFQLDDGLFTKESFIDAKFNS
jgi:Ca2+-binding RTX toxin-like protein